MRFALLGDVEAHLDGRRIDIGHMRQRCVLVALLLDVDRPVSVDTLIDRVWSDQAPHRARNALAGYISRLRTALGGLAEISREPSGYVLRTDAQIDLVEFRRLVVAARAADPATTSTTFDRALALWTGEPFASLDTPWISQMRTALETERSAVRADAVDAALRVGRHAELIGELARAHRDNPLDERLAGQLMIAQFRDGRQAQALDTFARLRTQLADELGVDPGPAVRAVYQQILIGDPGDVAAAPATAPPQATSSMAAPVREAAAADQPCCEFPTPTGLPRNPTSFIGRVAEVVSAASTVLEPGLTTLIGVGGVGKTRIATETAAKSVADDAFADGVWVCELAPIEDGSAVAAAVARTFAIKQQNGLDAVASIAGILCDRRVLLVLDNCEHVIDDAAVVVDALVERCPQLSILATSRVPLDVVGERVLPVEPLSMVEAEILFTERTRAGRPDFDLALEPAGAVSEVCRRLDGLPLAIELAAARMRMMSSLDIARRLDSLRLLSGGARSAHPRQQSLLATIDWSYRLLSDAEQELFDRLSVFAGGFDIEAAHAVCGDPAVTEDDTLDVLIGLVDKSMVVARSGSTGSRFTVLEMLRSFGRDSLDRNGSRAGIADRHAAYYAALAEQAAREMHGPDEGAWVVRMLPEYGNLRVAFERSMTADDVGQALRLVTSLVELIHLRIGYESSGWAERAVARADPEDPHYLAGVGFAARGAWNRGESERARTYAELAAGRSPGRGTGRPAYPGDVLADLVLYAGDAETALTYYLVEVDRARHDDDPIRLVWTLFYVAICYCVQRREADGVDVASEAVRVAETTGNPTARSMGRYALGLVLKKSDPDRALELFDAAAGFAESVQNFWWQGISMMEAAATRAVHGDPGRAARELTAVIGHWERVGDWSQQWLNLRYVARLLERVGDREDALVLHRALHAAGREAIGVEHRFDGDLGLTPDRADALKCARSALDRISRV